MWNYFFRVCAQNRTSVYLHLIVYVIDQLRTVFFILAAGSVVQPVPRSMMNTGVVDQEVQRQAVEHSSGRMAPVHGHTGTPAWRVCTLFTLAHEANADGTVAE